VPQRQRRIIAVVATIILTMLMWTDSPTRWWSSILEFLRGTNTDVASSVLDVRPSGDLDLHLALWALVGCSWWWALRSTRSVVQALIVLVAWASIVETLQPAFTAIRDRQASDYVGNVLGVGIVGIAVFLRRRYADGPMSPAT
jgi:hypothetical protein